ncbi:MAG: PCMD domain-containing protein [Prevotella sp.]|nr:PCMD domain-containing protein [Prevotella sp.]
MKKSWNTRRILVLVFVLSFINTAILAKDYTDKLLVLVNGIGTEQDATISVTEHDGLYDLNLKNFALTTDETTVPVGNVELKDIQPQTSGNATVLHVMRKIAITPGDTEGVSFWMGPMLGDLPVEITAIIEDGKVRARIGLDLMDTDLQQIIDVRFGSELVKGTGYHIPNGDFEEWHKSKDNNDEPNSWHSFGSASGTWASLAGKHIGKSDKGRNESTCARIYATDAVFAIANGTMTTGRLNAGSMSASNDKNNAYLDMSQTDKDGNGDPFYVSLKSRPDSLVLYMQFNQATTNKDHPYATVSAVITDGTYYQDPEDKTYTNVVAKAKNNKIAVTNGNWERISIPFEYTSNNVEPKAILVTISTNADPGQGSGGDEVLVDDITLVYNSKLSSLNVSGFEPDKFEYEVDELNTETLNPVVDGKAAFVVQRTEETEEAKTAFITVVSADMRGSKTYKVTAKKDTNGIQKPEMVLPDQSPVTSYGIDGRPVNHAQKGQIIIVRQADGKTVKVRK